MNRITVSIVGASGYAGGELLRILLMHPGVTIKQVTSRKYAGFPVTVIHPNLRGFTELAFVKPDRIDDCDLLFLCLPHGESQKQFEFFEPKAARVIDLAADFRLRDLETYSAWYGEHSRPDLLSRFVYGLPELHRDEIRTSSLVAAGGCESTCAILALLPLVRQRLIEPDRTVIDAKIASSAAGRSVSPSTHHPERVGVLRSYKPTMHRHTAEVEQELQAFEPGFRVHFSATAVEMVRGVLVTCHTFLKTDVDERSLRTVFREAYADEPFVRVVNEKHGNYRFPEPKILKGTNFCDVAFQKDARSNRVVVIAAIDNLGKGTAGQAVQAMNLMFGYDEGTALIAPGLHPV